MLDLLATYLHVAPSSLILEENAHGKPRLRGADALHFNWSHSGNRAVLALALNVELGVDIEQAREGVHVLELAQRFFAPSEAKVLAACDEAERENLFLQLWCAKEAVLKALGRGLAFGLERVEFSRAPDGWQPARFDAEASDAAWQVSPLRLAPDCPGALAWRGARRPVLAWTRA
ncbi:MAG: 4'-phosphopantetheinyl transferase family protein [Rhodanobacteraceae bacterium]